jgi:hypothetical protein
MQLAGKHILTQNVVPVRLSWKQSLDGKVALTVRSALRRIEFEKGRTVVIVSCMGELQGLIKGLIDTAQTGELDHQLAVKVEPQPAVRKRAA